MNLILSWCITSEYNICFFPRYFSYQPHLKLFQNFRFLCNFIYLSTIFGTLKHHILLRPGTRKYCNYLIQVLPHKQLLKFPLRGCCSNHINQWHASWFSSWSPFLYVHGLTWPNEGTWLLLSLQSRQYTIPVVLHFLNGCYSDWNCKLVFIKLIFRTINTLVCSANCLSISYTLLFF